MRRSIHLVLCAAVTAGLFALAGCGGSPGASPAGTGSAPTITSQPGDATVTAGETASYSVAASGSPQPRYQWRRNGTDIPGATAANYITPSLSLADGGAVYTVLVSNAHGSVASNPAALGVRPGSIQDFLNVVQLLLLQWEYYFAAGAPMMLVEGDSLDDMGFGAPKLGDPSLLCGSGTVNASWNGGAVPVGQAVPLGTSTLAGSFNACTPWIGEEYSGSSTLQATLTSLEPGSQAWKPCSAAVRPASTPASAPMGRNRAA